MRCAIAGVLIAIFAVLAAGCTTVRDRESTGSYVDDAATTRLVRARLAEEKTIPVTAITVETLNGMVQLSGFVRSAEEKTLAERIARESRNVRDVRNQLMLH